MKRLPLLALLLVVGCASAHVKCATDGSTTTVAIGGSTVGLQLLAMGQSAAHVAGFLAPAPRATPPADSGSYVDYSYVPIFGSDYVSCSNQLPTAPAPTVVIVPNGSSAQILK